MSIYIILISFLTCSSGWLLVLRSLFKSKGFDPSLVTYADPLALRSNLGYRLLVVFLLALSLLNWADNSLAHIIEAVVVISAVTHLIVLFMFNRQPTQPYITHLLFGSAALALIWRPNNHLAVIGAAVGAEIWLIFWQRTRQNRYDRWVAKSATNIDRKYRFIGQTMPASDWLWVVHVAVTESIARPKVVRFAERLYFRLKRPRYISTGIMQVRDTHPISDQESMRRGADLIKKVLKHMPSNLTDDQRLTWFGRHYNGSGSYAQYLVATKPGMNLFYLKHMALVEVPGRRRG